MSAVAASSAEVNPDLVTAQRVLAGLVRGSEDSGALVVWAVSVLRSPVGSQIVVASNVGGGWYLPPTVFLPRTARLAVNDPSLPMGWAEDWMGCQKPSKILVDHFERQRRLVAGVAVSAIVTTELWAEPPTCGGDFLSVQHRDAVGLLSEAPKLDAAHQHRLASIDPSLAQRVHRLDRPDIASWAAGALTVAVVSAAWAAPDETGMHVVDVADRNILQAVNEGSANAEVWAAFEASVTKRDEEHKGALSMPEIHHPRDNDGSDDARRMILWYRHYFRMGRTIELVRCWKTRPPSVSEVAYCGITAGFGSAVLSTMAALEQQLGGGA
jgi:hypothetical protein